ncbi:uncharacterized protein C12orf40 homolog [Ahaetulla prasina]|uniref:uncharacterized protein C12orf40 homolog n=1 Tax=Ahaetulla prasina TaxID=499056 RepID=UPI0026499F2F|nr:uncharacterized protein C12orf40 homolog [Ahaetulla prasina]
MNWVGGSRRRIMLTKERRKQKDFFEKEKLKSKMKLLGVSPLKSSAVSLDLLNLYVVNQISTKKENAENIRKPIHVDINRETQIPLRKQNVEFPKSPECRPAKLSLDDIQHRIQEEILDSRRKYLYEKASIHSEVSPGYGNSIDKDSGKSQANGEESLFGTINDQIKTNQDANFQPIASLFEEENQFLTFPPSQSYCSFAKKNYIDQLFTDFGDAKEIFGKPSLYDSEEAHQTVGPAHCAAERDLTSILTAPEMICSLNNQRLNAINQNPNWNRLKPCSSQKKNPVELSDQQKLTTFLDNTDDDSQLSSQSPTYSPEQADRHTNSSSDESRPEEGNEGASSDSEVSFSRTFSHPCSGSGHWSSEHVCQFDGRHRNTANIRSQAKSAVTPRKNTSHRAGLPLSGMNDKRKHEASSQTEACAEPVEKSNAAVQCDIIQSCPCKRELSFAHSAEMVTSTSKVDATGGQNVPADSAALQPPNSDSLSTKNLSPETDGFIVARSA